MQDLTTQQAQTETLMPPGTRGRPKKQKRSPAPTSVRLTESLAERLAVVVGGSPLTKNEILQISIWLGLDQLEANPKLLLEKHIELLQQKMPPKEGEK